MLSLLIEGLLHVRSAGGHATRGFSLPEVLALLARDEIESFPALRPHQRPGWHSFLVQVAGQALHRAERNDLPTDAGDWEALLRGLGGAAADTAWSLVVDD